jgi:hypothetical protein
MSGNKQNETKPSSKIASFKCCSSCRRWIMTLTCQKDELWLCFLFFFWEGTRPKSMNLEGLCVCSLGFWENIGNQTKKHKALFEKIAAFGCCTSWERKLMTLAT